MHKQIPKGPASDEPGAPVVAGLALLLCQCAYRSPTEPEGAAH